MIHRHLDLARAYRPARLDVDLLFLEAAVRPEIDLSKVMDYRPEAWRGYVRSLEHHAIQSDHQSMLDIEHAPMIATALQRHFQACQRTVTPAASEVDFDDDVRVAYA